MHHVRARAPAVARARRYGPHDVRVGGALNVGIRKVLAAPVDKVESILEALLVESALRGENHI